MEPAPEDGGRLPAGAVDRDGLRAASRRGILINYSAQFIKFGLQFIYNVVIARLLLPADFGVVAMAAPVLAFILLVADLGLSQAVIQRETVTHRQISFLFWVNVGLTAVLSILTIALAPLVAHFYNEPRVEPVVMALGALLMVGAFGSQHGALLNRHLAFGKMAAIELGTYVIAAAAAIGAALAGFGLWAIVINQAVISILSVVIMWIVVPWRPSWPRGLPDEVRSMLGFGGNVTIFNVVNFFARNLDNILIGKAWGESALGVYDRAYRLLLLPLSQVMGPISKVALPLLSRVQGDPQAYRKAYSRMLEIVVIITYPGVIFALVAHGQLIRIVLGEQWMAAAPIFAILAFGALFAPISNSTGWLLTTQGRTRELRNYGVVSSAGFVASFVIGLPWGPVGVAGAYIAFGTFQGPTTWWLTTRKGAVNTRFFAGVLAPYVLASLPVAAAVWALERSLPTGIVTLGALLIIAYIIFFAGLIAQSRSRESLLHLFDELDAMAGIRTRLGLRAAG